MTMALSNGKEEGETVPRFCVINDTNGKEVDDFEKFIMEPAKVFGNRSIKTSIRTISIKTKLDYCP